MMVRKSTAGHLVSICLQSVSETFLLPIPIFQHFTKLFAKASTKSLILSHLVRLVNSACKNLISKLIVVDPKKRISMADVCDHSWLNGGINFMDGSPTKTDSNHQIDQEIIAQMEDLGMNKADALNSIGKNCFDSLHGTYLILAYKKDNGIVIHEDINQPLSEVEDEVDETSDALANLLIGLERHKGAGTIESNTSITPLVKRRPTNRGKTEELKKEVVTLPQIAARNAAKAHQSNESGIDIGGAKFEIDVALYLPKDQDLPLEPENSRGPRTIRMAFNCVSISTLAPELFFQKVRSALELNEIEWVVDSYFFIGDWGDDLKFELEICKLPKLKSYGLRFKRLTGDMWEYKKLVAKITAQLQSPDQ